MMRKVVVASMFLTVFMVVGQEKQKDGNTEYSRYARMTPEQMATLQTKKMVLALDLTKDQQAKVERLNLETAKRRQAKMEQWKARKESGDATKPKAEDRFAATNDRLDQQIAMQAQMKQILNADQFEKWKSMAHNNGRHPGHRKGHGRTDRANRGHTHGKK